MNRDTGINPFFIGCGVFFAGTLIIASFMNVTDAGLTKYIPYFDKVMHFLLYGAMATLFWIGFARFSDRPGLLVLTLVTAIGLVDEALQLFNDQRSAHVMDMLANVTGVLFAVTLCSLWRWKVGSEDCVDLMTTKNTKKHEVL